MENNLKKWRRDLHAMPEIALQEKLTTAYIDTELRKMGYDPYKALKTGRLVYIDVNADETIAFRSDIDALPVQEETGVSFESLHEGYMHACGHDGHMSMLLGFADYLKDKKHLLKKNILLIFQPAEESIGGAELLVKDGILDKFKVSSIFGIHLYPELPQGTLASRPGEFMAMASEVTIKVHGKTAHGAMPHLGIDSNMVLAKLLVDFQTIQTRILSPLEYSIITFGKMGGGTVRNVVSDYAFMEGTIRAYNKETFNKIKDTIKQICFTYEQAYGVQIDVHMTKGYLAVVNDKDLFNLWKKANSEFPIHEFEKPLMIAEDFSFYQDKVPGLFFYVGTRNEEKGHIYSLHNSRFNFDEEALELGLKAYKNTLKEMGGIVE